MDSIDVGKKIRSLRMAERLTLSQLATALNIKKNMLSNYELGKSAISADLLCKIADYFEVSMDMLTGRNVASTLSEKTDKVCFVYASLYSDEFESKKNKREMLFTVSLPDNYIGNGHYFGLKITDESLDAKHIPLGSIAIAKSQSFAHSGDIIIYSYKDEKACYGVYSLVNDSIIISPCSTKSSYPVAIFSITDVNFKIIGKIKTVIYETNR